MRRIKVMFAAAIILAGAVCPLLLRPQESQGPTLEETVDFINGKLNGNNIEVIESTSSDGTPYRVLHITQAIGSHGCQLDYTRKEWRTTDGVVEGDPSVTHYHFSSDRILPSSSSWGWRLRMDYGLTIYSIALGVRPLSGNAPGTQSAEFYTPDDEEMAQRLLRAFKGWSKLCGAKDEPY